jgi:2-keto-3-deoxy-galactonokinase
MTRIGDHERERATLQLQRHYVDGRLSHDELAVRVGAVLQARSRRELRSALAGLALPWEGLPDAARTAGRAVVLVAATAFWFLFSVVLSIAYVIALVVHGPTLDEALGFPLVWLLGTFLLWRLWRSTPRRAASRRPALRP